MSFVQKNEIIGISAMKTVRFLCNDDSLKVINSLVSADLNSKIAPVPDDPQQKQGYHVGRGCLVGEGELVIIVKRSRALS